jgi:ABC-2 type transport system permease protein
MNRVWAMLRKELLELRRARSLLLGTTIPPLILTLIPIFLLSQMGSMGDEDIRELKAVMVDPALQGLDTLSMTQAVIGRQFSTLQLLMPLFIPSIIAAHSVVGEKTRRTLEPLLATPIRTYELLLAKCLAALVPAVIITWSCGGVFALCVSSMTEDAARQAILGPGWLLLLFLCAPLMSLLSTAASVLISSRVNDPRTAQQLSAVVAVPVMLLFFLQLLGVLVLSPWLVLLASLVLVLIDALVLWIAVRLFQRETILTKWS